MTQKHQTSALTPKNAPFERTPGGLDDSAQNIPHG
jgi:hypothetical protein